MLRSSVIEGLIDSTKAIHGSVAHRCIFHSAFGIYLIEELFGRTLHVDMEYDKEMLPDIREWFESHYTIQFANYPVDETYMAHGGTVVPGRK